MPRTYNPEYPQGWHIELVNDWEDVFDSYSATRGIDFVRWYIEWGSRKYPFFQLAVIILGLGFSLRHNPH